MKKMKSRGDDNYMEKDEKHDKKALKKKERSMSTAGIATALKKAKSSKDKAKLVKVKPTKKV